jgi:hypothetical protein
LIRCTVDKISIMGRKTRGVRLFATGEGERVVSVTRLREVDEAGGGGEETNGSVPENP